MHFALLATICCTAIFVPALTHDKCKQRKAECILMGLALFLFAALRGSSVGVDVATSCQYYVADAHYSYYEILHLGSSYLQSSEPVFHCFLHTLSFISSDPQFMLIVIGAILAIGFSYFAYHQDGSLFLSFLLFICLRIFAFTLTGLRQTVAIDRKSVV